MSFDISNFRTEIRQQYKKPENSTTARPQKAAPSPKKIKPDINNNRSLSPVLVSGIARILDGIILTLIGYITFKVYHTPQAHMDTTLYTALIVITAPLSIMIFQSFRAYSISSLSSAKDQVVRLWLGWTTAFTAMAGISFVSGYFEDISKLWLLLYYVSGFAALMVYRSVMTVFLKMCLRNGRLTKNVIIVGGGQAGKNLIRSIDSSSDNNIKICGVFDDRNEKRIGTEVEGYPVMGTVAQLLNFARENRVDLLIVTLPLRAEHRLQKIFETLWVLPIDIRLLAKTDILNLRSPSFSYIGQTPLIEVYDKPISDWDAVMKTIFDKVIALIAFILLSPVMLLTALAVKLESKGPAFFKQKRYGFNNELVEVYKFRSMYTDKCDAQAATLVTKGDPRVTRVGRFIRKTTLDELPQLFNVLKGELSLVGPRPHAVQAKAANKLYNDVVDGYFARHKVKPGITGWAQVNGWRGETDTNEKIQKRVEHDLYYIEHWSLLFDLYILAKTPFSLLNTKNAY